MLSCKDVTQRASALIDKELPIWEVVQMRLHLAICKGCSAFVRQMQITRNLTAVAPASAGDDEAAMAAILSRLLDETKPGD